MSTSVLTRTVASVQDKRLVLNNSSWAAKIDIGNAWNSIVLGMRVSMNDSGGDITGSPKFYFGLCSNPNSGFTNGPLSSLGHFVGIAADDATLTRATGPLRYTIAQNNWIKVGAVDTGFAGGGGWVVSADPLVRTVFLIMITRSGGNLLVGSTFISNATAIVDVSAEHFEWVLYENDTPDAANILEGLIGATGYTNAAQSTIPVDEGANGPLNAICVAWDRTTPFEFSDIGYKVHF